MRDGSGARENAVGAFQRQIGGPAAACVLLATLAFGVDDALGPRPLAWGFRYGTVLFYLPWLVALMPICACAAWWARRAGASAGGRLLVAVSPALALGGAITVLAMGVATAASLVGHTIHPLDAVGHFLVGWLVVPGALGAIAASPFLGSGERGPAGQRLDPSVRK
jgi:hypothetical protein